MGCCSQKLWIICLSASGVVLLALGLGFGVCGVFDKLINENVDKVSIYKKCLEKIYSRNFSFLIKTLKGSKGYSITSNFLVLCHIQFWWLNVFQQVYLTKKQVHTQKKKLIEHTCKADEREGVVSDIPIVSVKNTSEDLGKWGIYTISVKTIFKG